MTPPVTYKPPEPNEPPADASPDKAPPGSPGPAPRPATLPPYRRLRAFAFDPLLSNQLDTAGINEITLPVLWEEGLQPGPVGEYLEVVDYDPAGGCAYEPVDLNHPHLLATDGLAPSEGNPRFHQQMVYAVAMTTIRHFEAALGRKAMGRRSRTTRAPPARTSSSGGCALPARAARGERVLQSAEAGPAVRLLPGDRGGPGPKPAGRHGVHLPVARRHRPRDDARAARRHSSAVHRGEQPGRAGVP